MLLRFLQDTPVRAENLDEAAILEARKHAEQLLANQKSDLDSAAAWLLLQKLLLSWKPSAKSKTALNRDGLRLKKATERWLFLCLLIKMRQLLIS